MQHVFIVGSKSMGAYGGYETFVNKLTEYHKDNNKIKYHVACKANGDGSRDERELDTVKRLSDVEFEYHNARCFKINVPEIGSAQAIFYDVKALNECCRYIRKNKIDNAIVYVLACRIGPFMPLLYKKLHKLNARIFLNPDGHEWKRAKWSKPIRMYWKLSEKLMVKYSDKVICDSVNIEKYIHESYDGKQKNKKKIDTTYIAYGAETRQSTLDDKEPKLINWYKETGLKPNEYYLVVGRFVPENNYEIMIREFMKSQTTKDFAIITNANDRFLEELESRLHFRQDKRIKFVGTVYDQELLMKIRQNAYAYFHGHEVGGTNPSLLEALGSTKLNLLLNVGFNKEVAEDAAIYWNKKDGNLAEIINKTDKLSSDKINLLGEKAKRRIREAYSWEHISELYENVFTR